MAREKKLDSGVEKVTNEKPVSLAPLDFRKALEGLLKVKPRPDEKEQKDEEQKEKPGD